MISNVEMIGKRFGRLFVLEEVERSKSGQFCFKCICDCGNIKTVIKYHLLSGNTKSCGCLQRETVTVLKTTHNMYSTPTYKSWSYMLSRCNNPNDTAYEYYGGRGIKVCGRWHEFVNFYKDMGSCPKGLTIERKNNDLGYSKENCYWATRTIQSRNQRLRKDNTTGIAGVKWNNKLKKYEVGIGVNHKHIYIGYFSTIEQAKEARFQAEQRYWL